VQETEAAGMAPLVSVIIPAYRAAHLIAATLDSLLAQTFTDYEIILVNDGSPDTETLEKVLAAYRDRILYFRQENQGAAAARNTGIRAARGKYIAPLDADDLWAPDHLEAQLAVLEADPSIDMVYADARIFGDVPEAGKTVMELCPSAGKVTFERLVTRQCTVHLCVSLCRRESLLRAGLFDAALQRGEDIDMWLRLASLGGRIVYQRRVLGHYRRHPGSNSADAVVTINGFLAALDKAARDPHLTSAQKELVEQQCLIERANIELHQGKEALLAGDFAEATEHLTRANQPEGSLKLTGILILLRLAPGLVRALYRWRDRRQSDRRADGADFG
jgi:glycosyltransferase involved in cell wall biosynthesis